MVQKTLRDKKKASLLTKCKKLRLYFYVALLGSRTPDIFIQGACCSFELCETSVKSCKVVAFNNPNHSSMNSRTAAADVEQILSKVQTKNTALASFHRVNFIFLKKYDQSSSD